jgi:hypothetical protein
VPRVDVPITRIDETGVAPPAQVNADVANGHSVAYNDGRVWLEVSNVGASPHNVTLVTPGAVRGLAVADRVVAVPATPAVRLIGPLATAVYNQVDGTVHVDVDHADLRLRAYTL